MNSQTCYSLARGIREQFRYPLHLPPVHKWGSGVLLESAQHIVGGSCVRYTYTLEHSQHLVIVTGSAGCPTWSSAQSRSRASVETYSKKGSQGWGDELSRNLHCSPLGLPLHRQEPIETQHLSTSLSTVRCMEPGQKCSHVLPILPLRANTGHSPPFQSSPSVLWWLPSITHIRTPKKTEYWSKAVEWSNRSWADSPRAGRTLPCAAIILYVAWLGCTPYMHGLVLVDILAGSWPILRFCSCLRKLKAGCVLIWPLYFRGYPAYLLKVLCLSLLCLLAQSVGKYKGKLLFWETQRILILRGDF
jgi:hypothetical protein